jgi:beta-N-acetylhexosaminidase
MVMVSSAYYARIDPGHRAAFSSTVIAGLLRHDVGFRGVVISDDLSAAAMSDVAPGDRALRFLRAGGDLLIVSSPDQAATMARALLRAAEDDPRVAGRVTQSATRVLTMKGRRNLVDC